MTERTTVQKLFVRVCRDSRFKLGAAEAAHLAGSILGIGALGVWVNFASYDQMEAIAAGTHPACQQ